MTILKASIVIAGALAAMALMRQRSAALRHCVLAIALLFAGLMPLVERVAPEWSIEWRAAWRIDASGSPDHLLRAVWIAGAASGIAVLAIGLMRLAWMAASAQHDASPRALALVDSIARDLGIDRPVRLLESTRALSALSTITPVTWGVVRPTILLPAQSREWPEARLHAVLAHELAHVQRGDWALQIVIELVACMYWFNPLVWIARRRVHLETERACDDAVLNLGVEPADYASHLVEVARAARAMDRRWARQAASTAMARARGLERRVAATLNGDLDRAPVTAFAAGATVLLLGALAASVAGFSMFGVAVAAPVPPGISTVNDIQRSIMMQLAPVEKRLSIATRDISFRKSRIEGRVELLARLGVDGSPVGVRVVEPAHPDLAAAAEAIVRQWHREPARLHGVPVEVPLKLTIDFK